MEVARDLQSQRCFSKTKHFNFIYDFVSSQRAGWTEPIKRIGRIMAGFGEYSLGIYIISGRMVEIFLIGNLEKFSVNYLFNVLQAAAILGSSCFLTVLISKQPILNFVLLSKSKVKTVGKDM